MKNLNELAKQYKKTNSQVILLEIFKLLAQPIKTKARYIFYKQDFVKEKYEVMVYDKKKEDLKKQKRVRYFKLCDTNKIELEDIEQDLQLQVMELLKKYDPKKPFENYFNATLSDWRPSCVREFNFIKDLDTKNETELVQENQEEPPLDDLATIEPEYPVEDVNIDKMFQNLTKKEKNLLELMVKFPNKNQQELADIIGVTQPRVVQILKEVRKKYKKTL